MSRPFPTPIIYTRHPLSRINENIWLLLYHRHWFHRCGTALRFIAWSSGVIHRSDCRLMRSLLLLVMNGRLMLCATWQYAWRKGHSFVIMDSNFRSRMGTNSNNHSYLKWTAYRLVSVNIRTNFTTICLDCWESASQQTTTPLPQYTTYFPTTVPQAFGTLPQIYSWHTQVICTPSVLEHSLDYDQHDKQQQKQIPVMAQPSTNIRKHANATTRRWDTDGLA